MAAVLLDLSMEVLEHSGTEGQSPRKRPLELSVLLQGSSRLSGPSHPSIDSVNERIFSLESRFLG
jgi:hypothetical protein